MEKLCLQLAFFIVTVAFVASSDANAIQLGTSRCRSSSKCYSPLWCEAVISARDCSNRSRCCEDVYNKVQCLADLLDENSKMLNASVKQVASWLKNSSMIESEIIEFKKEVELLKKTFSDNGDKTKLDYESLRKGVKLATDEVETLEKGIKDFKNKYDKIMSETKAMLKHLESKSDDTYNKLDKKLYLAIDQLNSLTTTNDKQIGELQKQISHVTNTLNADISNLKKRVNDSFKKEMENVNERFNSFELNISEIHSKINVSSSMLNENLETFKNKSKDDLQATSNDMQESIKRIETQSRKLETRVETYQKTIESDIGQKTKKVFDQSLSKITQVSHEFGGKITELENGIESNTSNIRTELKQLKESLLNTERSLESKIKSDADAIRAEITNEINALDTKLQELSSSTKVENENTNTQLSNLRNDVDASKQENDESIETVKSTLTNAIQVKVSAIETKIDKVIEKVTGDIDSLRKEIGQLIKGEVDRLAKQTTEVNQTVNEQKEKVDIILPNTFNKEMFILAFLVLVVLLAINYCIVYALVKRTPPVQLPTWKEKQEGDSPAKSSKGSKDVLRQIPERPELKDGVCIISFDESRTEAHRRLLDSADIPNCKVEVFVVRRHEQIPNLPWCKVYLMCTEFSERHVIIEEPGKGLGDLHRTTYEGVQKLGGYLIILYTRDPGSRNLREQCLYNRNIYCVVNQPELSALENSGCFFSVFDKLTSYQKSELRRRVAENMT